ncbi:MAG TPA: S8 family serine peptidase, partial [Fimbriimonadaceae bacterium]|nr:S8 family serine peptidase [Fimbriimonadaceae bacterium]
MRRFLTLAAVTAGLFSAPLLPGGSPAVAGDGGANLQYVPGQVLIGYKNTAASFAKASAVSRVGGRVLEVIQTTAMMDARQRPIELAQVSIPVEQAIQILKSDPNVAYAEPNWIVRHSDTNDPYYTNGSLWGMYGDATSKVNQYGSQAGEAWHRNSGSKNVVVGVIDEGIDISHPDLKDNIWVNPLETVNGIDDDGNGYVDDINGWDFVNNDRTVYDGGNQDKHGTHVAGTIGAKGGNGVGVVGVNWSVTIVSLKFLGRNGGTLANAIKAIDYLTTLKNRQGIRVVASNNSW